MSKNFPYFSSKFSVIIYIFPLSAHITGSHPNSIAAVAPRWQDNELEDWGRKGTKQLRINSVESASSGRNSFAVTEVAVPVTSRLYLRPSHHPVRVAHWVYVLFFSIILFSPLLVVLLLISFPIRSWTFHVALCCNVRSSPHLLSHFRFEYFVVVLLSVYLFEVYLTTLSLTYTIFYIASNAGVHKFSKSLGATSKV